MSRNKEHGGAAFGGTPNWATAPLGLCSLFLFIYFFICEYLWIFRIYSIYICMCPKDFPSIFLRMFRNLFSEQ